MSNLNELIKDKNILTYDLTKNTGNPQRGDSLKEILSGRRELTNTNFNLISTYARGLGVKLTDILDDFDIDGTTSQIINISRHVSKLKNLRKIKEGVHKLVDSDQQVLGMNLKEDGFKYDKFKSKFDFIKPDKQHKDQSITETYLLNRKWLEYPHKTEIKNTTLADTTQKLNSHATTYLTYTPIEFEGDIIGGDLKIGVSVYDVKDNFLFTEVYGCEFMDSDNNKNIAYYKGRDDSNPITAELMEAIPKIEISELEFYNNLFTQYWKLGIPK